MTWRSVARLHEALRVVGLTMALVAGSLPCSTEAANAAAGLKAFFGTYVGHAQVSDVVAGDSEERDLDVVIGPYRDDGFQIRWVNVTLVDGRRDAPGVKRRVSEEVFVPAEGRPYFVEVPEKSVFAEREEVVPLGGDPIRWAVLDDRGLHTYAFVLLGDGTYELQTLTRRRTEDGLDLRYERIVDGILVRTIVGFAIKVE